ncbi:MAG TPA: DUF1028 domain-containing protein [Candidatus Heimdallarchaeota archaeon]|nr:DUF1028 domain-containing protein [Candidatus Heimdallarchaeota archaeon]
MIVPSTFSIVACNLKTGEWGIAVQSKFLAVGSAVPWAKAGIGAVATQSYVNTTYGPRGLALLQRGLSAQEALDKLVDDDPDRELRQAGIVDAHGRSASFTGAKCLDWAGGITGDGFACQGNILVSEKTVEAMADTFTAMQDTSVAVRLLMALKAGQKAGGDRRGQQSAALLVVKEEGGYGGFNDRYVDLRVDDHPTPIEELERIFELHQLYFAPPKPADLVPRNAEITRAVQEALSTLGYYLGDPDGVWSAELEQALFNFCGTENLEEHLRDDEQFDLRILHHMERLPKESH